MTLAAKVLLATTPSARPPGLSRPRRASQIFIALMLLSPSLPLEAQQEFSGSVALGLRGVDTSGATTKYREDINLDDGVRLLDLKLNYRPEGGDGPVDYVDLSASHLGGDPFESARVDVRKYGAYRLSLDRRRSEYFYDDTILPAALASIEGSTGGDFHTFEFERIRESATLDVTVSPATQVSLGLERQTRMGSSETTLDIERDEFELERPLDESSNQLSLGVRHAWQQVSLIFTEEITEFENASELFLPGASTGQNTADPTELLFFRLDQSYDYDSRAHNLRLLASPTEALDLRALWRREDLDLELQASEMASGIDFAGTAFTTSLAGPGDVSRDSEVAGVDAGLRISSRTRLVAAVRQRRLDQHGRSAFGADDGGSHWRLETDAVEIGAEHAVRPKLIIAGGWSGESRDIAYSQDLTGDSAGEIEQTDRDGYFLRLLFEPAGDVEISAAIEDNSIDDPFALASPTESRRYKASVKKTWTNGLALSGIFKRTDVANNRSGWAADTRQTDIRLTYRRDDLELNAGLSDIELDREIDQAVTGGTRQELYSIAYLADTRFADLAARWALSERIAIGGDLRRYENRGSVRIDRDDWRIFLGLEMSSDYALEIRYRSIDFAEDTYDDYEADILELAVRTSW